MPPRHARLYVGNLSSRTHRDDVYDDFRRYGRLHSVDLKRGFAFVEFEDPRDAEYAVRRMDGADVDGRRIIVEYARSRGPGAGGRGGGMGGTGENRVLVYGLGDRTSWQDLKDFARQAGDIRYTDVWMERGEKMGVMEYSNFDDMERALRDLDGRSIDGYRVELREDRARGRGRSRSPPRGGYHSRSRSRSPRAGYRSRSPHRGDDRDYRSRSRSPYERHRSDSRDRSRSPRRDSRSPSPRRDDYHSRSRSRSGSRSRSRSPHDERSRSRTPSRSRSRSYSRSGSRDAGVEDERAERSASRSRSRD